MNYKENEHKEKLLKKLNRLTVALLLLIVKTTNLSTNNLRMTTLILRAK